MKPMVDNASGGVFMAHTFMSRIKILDIMTKTSRAWNTSYSKVAIHTYIVGVSTEQCRREKKHDQDMTHIKTHMDLLIEYSLSGSVVR